jgi:hypothetical protein
MVPRRRSLPAIGHRQRSWTSAANGLPGAKSQLS